MVWHIFKKDWKLLWRLVSGLAAAQGLFTILLYKKDHGYPIQGQMLNMLQMIMLLASGILVTAAVHLDAIPGLRQDWLVRPIKRRDLLAAKLLFVILLVQGPILLTEFIGAAANGFPVAQSLSAAFSRCVFSLAIFYLPILAFASLTRNFTEGVAGAVIAFVAFAILRQAVEMVVGLDGLMLQTGAGWLAESAMTLIALSGTAVVLSVQYFQRKTARARGLTIAAGLLVVLAFCTPWRPAFAIQQRLSLHPGAAYPIALKFNPGAGRYHELSGVRSENRFQFRRYGTDYTAIYVPLGISGLPSDAILHNDRATVQLTGADGKMLDLGVAGDLQVRNEGPARNRNSAHHLIYVRDDWYSRIQDRPAQLRIDYSLTLLRLSDSHAMAAIGDRQTISGVGQCGTRLNAAGSAILISCIEAGSAPSCATYFLEHVSSGTRNPEIVRCFPDYRPTLAYSGPDAMRRFGVAVPFRDPTGLARFPVDGPQLRESRVVMRIYRAEDHFTRQIVIPGVRLSDWLPQPILLPSSNPPG
jgi:hypothetical protein